MNIDEFRALPKSEKRRLINTGRSHYLYRCYDTGGVLLYVGCTNDVQKRMYVHRRSSARATASWWLSLCMDRYEVEGPFKGRGAALKAERRAIRAEQPIFNTQERGHSLTQVRNGAASYLVSRGLRALAIETACTCWSEDRAEGEVSPWCAAHICDDSGQWPDEAVA